MNGQGIRVKGTLANIKAVDAKDYEGKITPATQQLQITILNDDGLDIINVKDSSFRFKKEDEKKDVEVSVAYTVVNGKAYFRLIS